ncbi:MAG: ribosomal RNA small subunit methyltransferase A [Omnitrophica WOR_2 bacterium RBG_13_44_8]|nr:MAG: ribosomal RNA small subunit methyltransferase A [Omnitrophica WOR_2 bacterium RBG_13_44_8]
MRLKPKKRLGQNFLVDKNIQRKLITAYGLQAGESVLEIGAGYGELTRLIARQVDSVYALEIDQDLCRLLRDNTEREKNIKIINRDILKFNLRRHFARSKNKIKVVGNIPYYITTPIIEHLLSYRDKVETVLITLQKEFARRITAPPGSRDYGSFSCFVQYYSIPKILFLIKKTCFSPPPKVDSCLAELKLREKPAVAVKNERLFFRIIRAAFNQRRKTLRNSLDGIIPQAKLTSFFKAYGLDRNIRPEDLALVDFARLAKL